MKPSEVSLGESFIGEGAEAAHVNTVLGLRTGPVGTAWATALATPTVGHAPFVAILRPGVAVKPMTLVVSKATITGDSHGLLVWGAAQAGIAGGVADALADGIVSADDVDHLCLIAAIWVNPAAVIDDLVYRNNRTAVHTALRNGAAGLPSTEEVLEARTSVFNPFFTAPPLG